jgi:transcriptional regulator with XRE-family HTH domain
MDKIKRLRQEKGWSIRELGRRAGLSDVCILQIERGKHRHPRIDTLSKLAKALDVAVGDLIQ